jgi:hypothetical protein
MATKAISGGKDKASGKAALYALTKREAVLLPQKELQLSLTVTYSQKQVTRNLSPRALDISRRSTATINKPNDYYFIKSK